MPVVRTIGAPRVTNEPVFWKVRRDVRLDSLKMVGVVVEAFVMLQVPIVVQLMLPGQLYGDWSIVSVAPEVIEIVSVSAGSIIQLVSEPAVMKIQSVRVPEPVMAEQFNTSAPVVEL